MALEIERKYLHVNLAEISQKLARLGAIPEGRHFESNLVLDDPACSIFKSGCLLRLRSQEWPDKSLYVLTYKQPAPEKTESDVKERIELEVEISSLKIMQGILQGLGYGVAARYEKLRESWKWPKFNVKADLDYLPFGEVLEIEGERAAIDAAAWALGLSASQISLKTYHDLNQDWRKAHNLPPLLDFVFAEAEKRRLRNGLGLP